MNHRLDQSLVGLLLAASAGYALMTLGPRVLRLGILAGLSRIAAGAPRMLGLWRWTHRLQAKAAATSKGACGGCEDCDAAVPPPKTSPPEVKIPVSKIGRRS